MCCADTCPSFAVQPCQGITVVRHISQTLWKEKKEGQKPSNLETWETTKEANLETWTLQFSRRFTCISREPRREREVFSSDRIVWIAVRVSVRLSFQRRLFFLRISSKERRLRKKPKTTKTFKNINLIIKKSAENTQESKDEHVP
jgi:hypothetical protein